MGQFHSRCDDGAPFFGDGEDLNSFIISAITTRRRFPHFLLSFLPSFLTTTMMMSPRLTAALLLVLTGLVSTSAWQTTVPHQHSPSKISRLTVLHAASPYSGGEDAVAQLPLLEAQLATLRHTDDGRHELEEKISNAKMAAEFGVRKAQADFYAAFSSADVEAMGKVWSSNKSLNVRCVHPGMESLNGKEMIMKSWAQIFSNESSFTITPLRTHIDICGQTAICSCVEETPGGGNLEALNVYHREGGTWCMTLHMASPIAMRQQGPAFL
jgi:ketosteroid isomerase-like protein